MRDFLYPLPSFLQCYCKTIAYYHNQDIYIDIGQGTEHLHYMGIYHIAFIVTLASLLP